MRSEPVLPIDDVLADITAALAAGGRAIVAAPPGAGKTTRIPLVLLDQPWLEGKRILLLEPRRLAARAAAERMAWILGERVGERVGLRSRLDTRVSARTRIEVVTEGVFTRLLQDDPTLGGVGAVLFDEFHERSLDADLGLALALDAQDALREDLRIIVMSATLDTAGVAALLGGAPVIASQGRTFPIETRYLGAQPHRRLEDLMADAIGRAVRGETGSLLAFLPGVAEIRRTAERVRELLRDAADVDVVELHGSLDQREQARAIAPTASGRRKIVLATAIAQTSITIEGVRVVVDSGLERVPRYDAEAGVTRLVTVRASRATVDQRRGRAGRTEPGICYRLWDEPQTAGLMPYTTPEILSADLAGLVLDCAAWGEVDPARLRWLDPPPAGPLAAARSELVAIEAIDGDGALTRTGTALRGLPLPPRLARMLLEAAASGQEGEAAEIAAVLVERGLGGTSVDIDDRLAQMRRDRSERGQRMRRLAGEWARRACEVAVPLAAGGLSAQIETRSTAALLAIAFPDRIARRRANGGEFVLAGGRGAVLDPGEPLAQQRYLVVADMSGRAAAARILGAARLDAAELESIAGPRIASRVEVTFDTESVALRARAVRRLGAIVLESETRPVPPGAENAARLAEGIAGLGVDRLPWSSAQRQLRDRIAFLKACDGPGAGQLPDLSDTALAATAGDWLAPFLGEARRLSDVTADMLDRALASLVPYGIRQQVESELPCHFTAPTGNRHRIDYEGEGAPIVAVRVQELYGLKEHPALAGGRLPLTLHLLSPASRPIQITRDLPRFWSGSWREVKSEMKGRYPRHEWPDDPANALPTARAKRRT
ncbi:MAG: ATP-dependent helicase HrpB [Hyphomicrobiaceae bacterium]